MNESNNKNNNCNVCHNCSPEHNHAPQLPPEDYFDLEELPRRSAITFVVADDTGDWIKTIGIAITLGGIIYDLLSFLNHKRRTLSTHNIDEEGTSFR